MSPVDPDADHRLAVEAELHRVGDRDDLHDARLGELLHALAHGGLAEPDRLADLGVEPAAVVLQLLDDRLRDVVEVHRHRAAAAVPDAWQRFCQHAGFRRAQLYHDDSVVTGLPNGDCRITVMAGHRRGP